MKILQVNVTYGFGSTGKLVKSIHEVLTHQGHESHVAFGRHHEGNESHLTKIGTSFDVTMHGIKSRLLDRHGYGSKHATMRLLKAIDLSKFDIIHLHNIHGYYLHIETFMNALKQTKKPVIWTLHDAWAYTGHCAYYDQVGCLKWQTGCFSCPQKRSYPASVVIDQSKRNFWDKKALFQGFSNLTLVTPSMWLKGQVEKSFLKDYPSVRILNGIDLSRFTAQNLKLNNSFTVLGVASYWEKRKGLDAFKTLSSMLPLDINIIIVGQLEKGDHLPERIHHIPRTENVDQLISIYQQANCFVNPTIDDNLPTTSIESLASGTPVITYNTGGSSEIIDEKSGILVDKYDIKGLYEAIIYLKNNQDKFSRASCLERAKIFDQHHMVSAYLALYREVLS